MFSFFTSTQFIFSVFIMLIVVVAAIHYVQAGSLMYYSKVSVHLPMEQRKQMEKNAEKDFMRVTLGLFFVLAMFLLIYTFRQDLITSNPVLSAFRTETKCALVEATTQTPSQEKGRYTMFQPCLAEGAISTPAFSGNGATSTIKP